MRISRSPHDRVVEIDLRSFGLKGLFALVTLVACVLCFVLLRQRVPLREATIVHAFCFKNDWKSLTKSIPRSERGDYTVVNFDFDEPAQLVKQFPTRPVLWGDTKISELIPKQEGYQWGSAFRGRHRPLDQPVDGVSRSFDPNIVDDDTLLGGSFERSPYSKRYFLDFTVDLSTTTLGGRQASSHSSHQLKYSGSAKGDLIVFAIPVDDDLMHLVIVDLNNRPESSRANGQ